MSRGRRQLAIAALLTGAMAVGLLVREPGLDRSLWIDELATAWVVRDGFSSVAERARLNNLGPAYFYTVRGFVSVLGYSEFVLRLPSLIAGLLCVPALFLLTLLLTRSSGLAALSSALAALDPNLAYYSLEARPYPFVQLLVILQVSCFVLSWRVRSYWVSLAGGLLTALIIWFHYLGALLPISEGLFLLLVLVRDPRRNAAMVRHFMLSQVVAVLLVSPLTSHILYLADRKSVLGWARESQLSDVFLRFHALQFLAIPACAAVFADLAFSRNEKPAQAEGWEFPTTAFLACWGLFPSAAIWLMAQSGSAGLNDARYGIVASVVPLLGCIRIVQLAKTRIAQIAAIGACVAALQLLGPPSLLAALKGGDFPVSEDWRGAVALINGSTDGSALVLVDAGLVETTWLREPERNDLLGEYLSSPVNSIYPLESARAIPTVFRPPRKLLEDESLREVLRIDTTLWLLRRGPFRKRYPDNLASELRSRGICAFVGERGDFANVHAVELIYQGRSAPGSEGKCGEPRPVGDRRPAEKRRDPTGMR